MISIFDIIGWIFNFTFLKGINSEWSPMRVITAICFIFSGIAMIFIQICLQNRWQNFLPKVLAIIISTLGLFTVAVYINVLKTGTEFSFVNSSFFNLFLAPDTRMALVTASLFFILGIVLFLLSSGSLKSANIAHTLVLPVSIINYMVIMSYILQVHKIHNIQNVSVALNSGIAFLSLCFAILFIRTDTWFMKVFSSESAGGRMARILLPVLMVLPIIIGWFRIIGEQMNLYHSEVGVLLVAITYVMCFLGLVWLSARSINKSDEKRQKLQNNLIVSGNFKQNEDDRQRCSHDACRQSTHTHKSVSP